MLRFVGGLVLCQGVWWLPGCHPSRGSDANVGAPVHAPVPVHVTTWHVSVGPMAQRLEGLGHVAAWQRARVVPQVDGVLEAIHVVEGQHVRRGASLVQLDARAMQVDANQARAIREGAQARLTLSRLLFERAEKLRAHNLNAQQDVDQARATLLADTAALADADAQLARAELKLDYARVPAPIDGICGVRAIDLGNMLRAGDAASAIVEIAQTNPAAVMVSLPEDVLPDLLAAQCQGPVEVVIRGRSGTAPLARGTLWVVDNQVQAASGTVRVKVRVDNPDAALWPGQFVRAQLLVGRREGVKMVPAQAVASFSGGPVVWTVDKEGRAAQRQVKLGASSGGWTEIADGLLPDETIIIAGQHLLRPGREVVPQPAPADAVPAPADAL